MVSHYKSGGHKRREKEKEETMEEMHETLWNYIYIKKKGKKDLKQGETRRKYCLWAPARHTATLARMI